MEVSEAIHRKRAVRKFERRGLQRAEVDMILDAGRRAQSSKNRQAWHFVAVEGSSVLDALSKCGEWAGHLAGAALGVAILTPDPLSNFQTMFDAGQAAAYMQLAAWDRGIGSCLASIYDTGQARSILGFPENLHVRIMLSFGYPADPNDLSRPPRKGGRRRLDEVVHYEAW